MVAGERMDRDRSEAMTRAREAESEVQGETVGPCGEKMEGWVGYRGRGVEDDSPESSRVDGGAIAWRSRSQLETR